MGPGGRLVISTRQVDHSTLEVAVADNGSGMDVDTADRAIEPFFTTKPIGKGSGLGLSQVYGMVEQLGGRFELETAPGQGTTVRLFLPTEQQAAQANHQLPVLTPFRPAEGT
jgi:signal transduction histidine kinase